MQSPTNGKKEAKMWWRKNRMQWLWSFEFRERMCAFSLDCRAIRLSEVFGVRRKAALCDEAYTWAPVLGVFDKLREVGNLSYLGFTLYLSVL